MIEKLKDFIAHVNHRFLLNLEHRSTFLATIASAMAIPFSIVFIFKSFHTDVYWYYYSIVALFLVLSISLLHFVFTGKRYFLIWGITLGFSLFCLVMFLTGGIDGTGFIWYFCLPPLLVSVLRLKASITILIVLTIVNSIALFTPWMVETYVQHTLDMKVRFGSAMFVITVISILMEMSNEAAFQKLEESNKTLNKVANTDPLTHIPNRRFMENLLKKELARFERHQTPFTVVLFDLDKFKRVNDVYGHDIGDEGLILFAGILRTILREEDFPCRWGGEEFLVLLPDCDKAQGKVIADRVREALEKRVIKTTGAEVKLTVSGGVADIREKPEINKVIQLADERLYMAKENGRNQII